MSQTIIIYCIRVAGRANKPIHTDEYGPFISCSIKRSLMVKSRRQGYDPFQNLRLIETFDVSLHFGSFPRFNLMYSFPSFSHFFVSARTCVQYVKNDKAD